MKRQRVIPRCKVLRQERERRSIRKALAEMRADLLMMQQPWSLFSPPTQVLAALRSDFCSWRQHVARFFGR